MELEEKIMPERIVRSRKKGWRKPEGSVCVTRPGKWGNFLKMVGNDQIYIDAGYRRKHFGRWVFLCMGDINHMLKIYECIVSVGEYNLLSSFEDLQYWAEIYQKQDVKTLKRKDICCFCKIGEPCHGDILLKLANK